MRKFCFFFLFGLALSSCRKYLEVGQPGTQISRSAVFENDATATSAMLAIYSQMESSGLFYYLSSVTGLSSDELHNYSFLSDYIDVSRNNLQSSNIYTYSIWTNLYKQIYQANAVIEGIEHSDNLTQSVAKVLKGEAYFIRGLCYFYLVNLYGPIPLSTTSDYRLNSLLSRSSVDSVYEQAVRDVTLAKSLLSLSYRSAANTVSTERVRPNSAAAAAVLARIYLYRGEWSKAEEEASYVINQSSIYSLSGSLDGVFLKNSSEAIWQLQSVIPQTNSYLGNYILTAKPSVVAIEPAFEAGFRPGDLRSSSWTKSISTPTGVYFFPYKYKQGQGSSTVTEYTMVLRLAEQYLIRSEARARQNHLSEANTDLNMIRIRAGLPTVSIQSGTALIDSIQNERRFELAFENGDRWLNLKRTGTADGILGQFKGADWTTDDQLYPIPRTERLRNPNLSQNHGY